MPGNNENCETAATSSFASNHTDVNTNDTVKQEPASLIDILFARAAEAPDSTALLWCEDESGAAIEWSYARLLDESRTIAARVRAADIGAGERVLLLPPQGLPYVAGFLGSLIAGVVPVTLPAPRSRRN